MPRRPRIHLDGLPLHIVQRGHNRQSCFFGEEDYQAYLYWLGEALKKEQCALHAYALMTNHVHLLVTPVRAESIPRLIIALGRRYVQYINTTYRRTGTLWDSRYKSSLIQTETYFLSCQRYIELNPVRAAMVDDPAHYRWTSYRYHALWGKPTLIWHRTRSIWLLGEIARKDRLHIVNCSGCSWTARRLRICVWHSIKISRWVIHASMQRSKP